MPERNIDDADTAVDELRRKARRRLVGAIVLALAAAILIPLLLEKDPRPLGDQVSIQIPPVDDSKFVSRLSVDNATGAKADGQAVPPVTAADAGAKGDAKSAAKSDATVSTKPPATAEVNAPVARETKSSVASEAKPTATIDSKSSAPAEHKAVAADVASVEPTATQAPAPTDSGDAQTAETKRAEGFVVQLAAFTDDKGANSLANKLKKAGYPAYTEPVDTQRGKLWRVRVGGYPSRAEAKATQAKLKTEGHDGIVAVAK